jgi:hypothetical protein
LKSVKTGCLNHKLLAAANSSGNIESLTKQTKKDYLINKLHSIPYFCNTNKKILKINAVNIIPDERKNFT